MSMNNTSVYRSPCEVLRKINDMFQGDGEISVKTRQLLAECEEKAKQMSIHLSKYEPDFYQRWDKNDTANDDGVRRKMETYKYHKL